MKTSAGTPGLPAPPRKGWEMRAHPNGQWYKQHNGRRYYFGGWAPDSAPAAERDAANRAAEKDFNWRWPEIKAGRPDPKFVNVDVMPDTAPLDTVANLFLHELRKRRDQGQAHPSYYHDVRNALKFLLDFTPDGAPGHTFRPRAAANIPPAHWQAFRSHLEAEYATDTVKRWVGAVYRPMANWARENHRIEFQFGPSMAVVPRSAVRAARRFNEKAYGPKLFPREQVPIILEACPSPLDAMLLLALNTGFGNGDCGALARASLDLDAGWYDFDRVKTGVRRCGYLWPVTVERLRKAIASRPDVNRTAEAEAIKLWESRKPVGKEAVRRWELARPDWDGLVFITRFGRPWVRLLEDVDEAEEQKAEAEEKAPRRYDAVGLEFRKVLKALDVKYKNELGKAYPRSPLIGGWAFKRTRVSFYAGRHTFYTAAKRVDAEAANFLMGHADDDMGEWYDHLDDEKRDRLALVAEVVGARLLPNYQTSRGTARGTRLRLVGAGGADAATADAS